jgi:hypothetical protein
VGEPGDGGPGEERVFELEVGDVGESGATAGDFEWGDGGLSEAVSTKEGSVCTVRNGG